MAVLANGVMNTIQVMGIMSGAVWSIMLQRVKITYGCLFFPSARIAMVLIEAWNGVTLIYLTRKI